MLTKHFLCCRFPPGTFIAIIKLTHHNNLAAEAVYPHFSDEETEAQLQEACSKSIS